MNAPRQAIVIGAGISGLACALRLRELGVGVRVLEAAENPGGVVATVQQDGFLFESGPQSFLLTPELRELIRSAGLESEILEASMQTPRYVLRNGKLHLAPMSPPALLTTSLLSVGSKMRVFSEPFRRSEPAPAPDESFADFVRRKFGTEILEYLAGPFVSGVFAGDPEKLSVRSAFPTMAQWEEEYGSVIRGAMKSRGSSDHVRPTLATLKRGVGSLLDAIAAKLGDSVSTSVAANSIAPTGTQTTVREWTVRSSSTAQSSELPASAIVLAIPAYEVAKLLGPLGSAHLAPTLAGIPYAPVAVVAQAYRREQVAHTLEGFGFLVPRTSKLRTLGVIWNSSLFPGRCPAGTVLMTSFLGGAMDPEIVKMDEAEIVAQLQKDIGGLLQIAHPPIAQRIWRHARALPQYNLGHSQRVAAIRDELSNFPGIFIAGNYLDGPSIGSCVAQALQTAKAAAEYLPR
ncbi:MAG TPA: protoporphyrinogen oxidase [Candidatus Acidoferrales bacterium]|nr:protoporphyrinogen oxidase [Candidatus Acidoferrales bacterium]